MANSRRTKREHSTPRSELSSPAALRALIRDAVELDVSTTSDPKTRALMRRTVASCDATTLLDNGERSQAAYDR